MKIVFLVPSFVKIWFIFTPFCYCYWFHKNTAQTLSLVWPQCLVITSCARETYQVKSYIVLHPFMSFLDSESLIAHVQHKNWRSCISSEPQSLFQQVSTCSNTIFKLHHLKRAHTTMLGFTLRVLSRIKRHVTKLVNYEYKIKLLQLSFFYLFIYRVN